MVRTRQTASLQLSRTPWTPRRKRRIWRAKRIEAARNSRGCSEPWSKKLDGTQCDFQPHRKDPFQTNHWRTIRTAQRLKKVEPSARACGGRYRRAEKDCPITVFRFCLPGSPSCYYRIIPPADRSTRWGYLGAGLYIEQTEFYRESARAKHTDAENAQYEKRRKCILELFTELDGLRKAA